jgi:hypothetical protein
MRALAVAAVAYAVVALLAYRPIWPGDNSRLPTCACGDLVQGVWFLRWTSFALLHGHNPFLTDYIDYPSGVNLAQNTSMPLLGVVVAPFTWVFGPVAGLNVLLWLSFPVSASAGFVACRRWARWVPAAFVGGLLYGFSPYMIGQGAGHLNLLFVPFPPLILLAADELLVRQRWSPRRTGVTLGLLGAAQFLVSPEIFGSTLVVATIGVVVLALTAPRQFRRRVRHALGGLVWAVPVCGLIIGYPAYLEIAGPGLVVGSAHGSYPFPDDLLSPVVPDANQLFAPSAWVAVGNRFVVGDIVENGGYLGIPFLALLCVAVVQYRREAIVRFAAVMAVAAGVLSLGPSLTVDSRTTAVKLPFALLDHLPLVTDFVDARFSLYVDLFAALILAVWIDRMHARSRRRPAHGRRRPALIRASSVVLVCATTVALIPLVPRWPYPSFPTSVPSFFRSAAVGRVPPGSVALTYPYPDYPNLEGMLWQAEASMRFRIVGGYALVPGVDRQSSYNPFPTYLPSVPSTLVADEVGGAPSTVVPGTTTATPAEVRAFLRRYRVETVIGAAVGVDPDAALTLLAEAIGTPPDRVAGVDVWFGVQQKVATG